MLFLWKVEPKSKSEGCVSHIFTKYLMKSLASKEFSASFKWGFSKATNFWSFIFELSIKSSIFVLQNCLFTLLPLFPSTLIFLWSWREILEYRTIFVDGSRSVNNLQILFKLYWKLEKCDVIYISMYCNNAWFSSECWAYVIEKVFQVSLVYKVLSGIYFHNCSLTQRELFH